MLLCSPNYLNKTSLPLCVLGELESQSLAFSKQTTVWASPANAGSLDLANEIAATFAGFTISTTDDRPASATHMLLYLNKDSFVSDERLAEQVKQAREDRLKIVMAHENDPALGGCQFSRFFETTPQERMSHSDARPEPPLPPQPSPPNAAGAHRRWTLHGPDKILLPRPPPQGARPLSLTASSPPHRAFREEGRPCPQVSLVLLAKSLGATPARADLRVSGSIAEAGDLISGGIGEGRTSLAKRSLGGLSRVFAKMSSRSSAEARDVSAGEASSVQRQV